MRARIQAAINMVEQARLLLEIGKCEEAIEHLDTAISTWPGSTIALAWKVMAHLRAGQIAEAGRALNIEEIVLEDYTASLDLPEHDRAVLARGPSESIDTEWSWVVPGSHMPITLGELTSNLPEVGTPYALALHRMFEAAFATYLSAHPSMLSILRLSNFIEIRLWALRLRPAGSVGAHFHPKSWLSAVYYPEFKSRSPVEGSYGEIVLGIWPVEMGNSDGFIQKKIKPQSGRFIVFPSALGHCVVKTSIPRLSFAADLTLGFNE